MFNDLKKFYKFMNFYLKGHFSSLIIGFTTSFIFSIISLATPYLTKYLIDVIFEQNKPDLLVPFLFICSALLIIMSLAGVISDFVLIKSFEQIKLLMRYNLFSKLLKGPIDFISNQGSGALQYRIFGDSETIQGFLVQFFINIPLNIFFSLIIAIIMISWHYKMAFFVLFIFVVQNSIIFVIQNYLLIYALHKKAKMQSLSSFTVERFRNIQLIRSLNIENKELYNFKKELEELKNVNIKSYLLAKVSELSIILINNLWSFGILLYGGKLVLNNQISLGTLMAFLLISNMLYPQIASIMNNILSFQDVRASLNRFMEYLQIPNYIEEKPNAKNIIVNKGEVVFENVFFGYSPNKLILKGTNFRIKPCSITAIVGRSGAGKSTIAKLLIRMYDPYKGKIFVDGTDIKEVTLDSLRKNIGYLVQGEYLFKGTILENICYGLDSYTEEQVILAAKKACIHEFIEKLPCGYNTLVGEGGVQLSGGEAQRIALARAFLMGYKILIMDEFTSFIDSQTEYFIQETLQTLKETTTIIIISHRLSTLNMADEILVLDQGVIVDQDTHSNLIKKGNIYLEILNELNKKTENLNVTAYTD